jgi:hypothetical protein
VQVKRGCNRHCSYCVEPLIEGGKYIFRDVEAVIEKLTRLSGTHPGVNIFFVDTEFNLPHLDYPMTLVRKILERGLHEFFRFSTQMLPSPFNPDFAKLLEEAGFSVIFTCDSFSEAVLKSNSAPYGEGDIIGAIELCERYGLSCTLAMIFGLPGESRETIDRSIEFMRRYPPTLMRRYEYTVGGRIYMGTPLCRLVEKGGRRDHLFGEVTEGWLEPCYFCSPWSPRRLKEYLDSSFPYTPSYTGGYDPEGVHALSLAYLADRDRWEETLSGFTESTLRVRVMAYDYLFKRLTGLGMIEEGRRISIELLRSLESSRIPEYAGRIDLIRFYLSHLKPC